jgi:hypothetical protein
MGFLNGPKKGKFLKILLKYQNIGAELWSPEKVIH